MKLYEQQLEGEEREWSLTAMQKERLGSHLETEYATLVNMLGENFHSVVIRMAVQIMRIAMILTAMRMVAKGPDGINEVILCKDEDYETAEMIGNKLLMHIAGAYQMIEGDKQELVPEVKVVDQRKILYEQLGEEYEYKQLIEEAQRNGISRRTVERWNIGWQEDGIVEKLRHGLYKKVV